MTSSCAPMAYLVSRYPAVSHTFILREIQGLRALGHSISTASINPPDRAPQAMEAYEKREAENTFFVKAQGWRGALAALLYWCLQSPATLYHTLRLGLRLGKGGSWFYGLAYVAEAALVARWMRQRRLQVLHVHFGNASATVGVNRRDIIGLEACPAAATTAPTAIAGHRQLGLGLAKIHDNGLISHCAGGERRHRGRVVAGQRNGNRALDRASGDSAGAGNVPTHHPAVIGVEDVHLCRAAADTAAGRGNPRRAATAIDAAHAEWLVQQAVAADATPAIHPVGDTRAAEAIGAAQPVGA